MDQPLVSVLLPTRQRIKLVEKSIASVLELATAPAQIEIAIAYDDNDHESIEYFNSQSWKTFVESHGSSQLSICCPPWGYDGLHHYYNLLAEKTQGQWLLAWNDDAAMLTPGWDQQLQEIKDFKGMVHMECTTFPRLTLFPLIPRDWVDLFGCITGGPHIDSWIQEINRVTRTIKKIDALVLHDRFSETGNNNDETFRSRTWGGRALYHTDEMKQLRADWAQRWSEFVK